MTRLIKLGLLLFVFSVSITALVAAAPLDDGRAAYQRGDYATAMRLLRPLADQGNAEAQNNLGVMYAKGQGVPLDYAEAMKWYRKAAEHGYAAAQSSVGTRYYLGQGVPQDNAEAVKWYRKAAEQGYAEAQNNLGVMYAKGQGVPLDYAEALNWFRKAADQGNAVAQIALGFMYANGQGVPQNYAEAVKWNRKAADQGNVEAQSNLGFMYGKGQGVPQDYSEALNWFRKAAEQGYARAQNNLGFMYANGFSVPQDNAEAVKWYRKAAEQGYAEAQSNLANLDMPAPEKLLIAAVEKARLAYAAGANEMAQGAARPARAKEICAGLKDLRVSNWLGDVQTLSSNSDGLGVLSIQIAEGIVVKTWNNALSDVIDTTLIDPDSTVFKQAVVLKKGQKVRFGGQFLRNPTDCIREGSLTLKGSLTQPAFIFRFSDLAAIE